MNDTIVAVASPPGVGAVSLIRLSGSEVLSIAGKMLESFSSRQVRPRQVRRDWVQTPSGERVDDVLVTYFGGPASYTGEDVLEITGHGGILVTRKIVEQALAQGARLAEPGEFSQRAFLNGKLDLTQAEAVMDLIHAQTDLAARAAREQLSGKLGGEVAELRETLINVVAHVEAYIDFPDEDISPETGSALDQSLADVASKVRSLLGTAKRGRLLREGARLAIIGAPNAGKSSLLNALLGYERAIVSAVAGTTRDTVEEVMDFDGVPVRVIDTAGLRDSGDAIEVEGIARARERMKDADVIIELVDASQAPAERLAEEALLVLNKVDLGIHPGWGGEEALQISAATGDGLEELRSRVRSSLWEEDRGTSSGALIAINTRHQDALRRALDAVEEARAMLQNGEEPEFAALPLREALNAVGEVGGRIDTEEILGSIFGQFCIGK
ncbi:MAG: tRNA uridine-5-carboxymethylaminomethyl(34) synthesis GTPase MnmE [Verrucomicrobiota bacterium JB023]|nr:tRNA uridine-5-carboxymethylaminomethyl(34) synthesis GTPase MnmE [Verrucomicrobiota bacterium JB023]